jgi:hypothetical protein
VIRKGSIAHFYFRQGWYLEGKRPREVGRQRLVNVRHIRKVPKAEVADASPKEKAARRRLSFKRMFMD